MSDKYKIYDQDKPYFLTLTIVGWMDLFTRKNHKILIADSLRYCQKEKGLLIFGYCIMPSHLHLIARTEGKLTLSEILRDFKKYTSKALIDQILEEPESRRNWMLQIFESEGKRRKRAQNYKLWQDGCHAEVILSNKFFYEKLNYIHNNPVKELIVERPENFLFSSARNYAGLSNYLEIVLESVKQESYRK